MSDRLSRAQGEKQARGDPARACPGCNGPLHFKGRRMGLNVYLCEAADCPASLVELHDPSAPQTPGPLVGEEGPR
jgi:hypothetical protein